MIIYNMRNRGPLEYDKFALNVFQLVNLVNFYIKQTNSDEMTELCNKFDLLFNDVLKLSEQQYEKYIVDKI